MKRGSRPGGPVRAGGSEFPGEIAGASLKRPPPRLPRAVRAVEFPGEIAGASLKRRDRHHLRRAVLHEFPGEIAGASLKRELDRAPPQVLAQNSPAKSPGPH